MGKLKNARRLKLDAQLSYEQIGTALRLSKGFVAKDVGLAATAASLN